MKTLALATITAFTFAGAASAADIGTTGISAGAEGEVYWDFDAEDYAATVTPYLGYTIYGVDLSVESEINLRDIDFTGLDLSAEYDLMSIGPVGTTLFGEVNVDKDLDFNGAQMGMRLKF
jgi:opacity protein-like surface antigen